MGSLQLPAVCLAARKFLWHFIKCTSESPTTEDTNSTTTASFPGRFSTVLQYLGNAQVFSAHNTPVYQRNRRKWNTSFSRLFGKPRQQRTTNDSVQKTNTYRQITRPIILQPDVTQSHDYKDSDETSATSVWHTEQLTWRKQISWTCFSEEQLQHWLY